MVDAADGPPGLTNYVNVPRVIGALISGGMATLWELQSVYGIMDAYNLLEVMTVDTANQRRADKWARRKNQ